MERVRIGKDIVFQWEVRKDGAALTAGDAANLTLEIAGRNGKSQRLPFEIRDSKIIAAWYGVQQTEIGAYRLTCWHNRGKVGESVVDVVWAVELVRYTTEETFDDIEAVTIELEGGNLTFAALKGASAYEVAVAEGFVGTEAEWIASLKKPAEDAAEDAEEAAARAIEAAENAGAAATIAETAAQTAENAAGDANTAAGLANSAADNAEAKAQLADAAADNANTAANEAYNKAQEADTAATTATNAAQSANSAAASADEAARGAVEAAVEATQSAENAQTQADNARYAADYANEMAIAAEKVNAQLNGNVLTITNRQGTSTSVNTKGEQGEQGNPGQAATISVGTTTTGAPGTDAQVTNSGTSSAAVLDFTIPQGAKGDKGDQGEPGEVTEAELEAAVANKANTDGYYSRMIVGGAESVIGDVPQTATYTFRRTGGGAIGEPVARLTEIQGNTGVVNQLAENGDFSDGTTGWTIARVTVEVADGVATVIPTTTAGVKTFYTAVNLIADHKYYVGSIMSGNTGFFTAILVNGNVFVGETRNTGATIQARKIVTMPSTVSGAYFQYRLGYADDGTPATLSNVNVIDLTLEYGAGNEPGTVAEFEARIWRDYGKTLDEYIAYTTGKLINCKAVALESVGLNQWDEEWEVGNINDNGVPISAVGRIRSKNYFLVLPSTEYRAQFPNTGGSYTAFIYWYDAAKTFISRNYARENIITTPANAQYAMFACVPNYGATYNHDICINISDAALNGTYRPYKKDVVNLNLTTLTGINPTTGVRETIFPNGMRSKGDVRDVISGNTATVKIGDPTQETPLENTVLATPIVYTDIQYADGTPFVLPKNFEVQNDGTERITHAEGEDSIAPVMSAIYGLNAVGFVQDAPKEYTSQATLDGLIAKISAITGTTITKTWDAANNKWTFS